MLFLILANYMNIVNLGTAEAEAAQDTIDKALEGLGGGNFVALTAFAGNQTNQIG